MRRRNASGIRNNESKGSDIEACLDCFKEDKSKNDETSTGFSHAYGKLLPRGEKDEVSHSCWLRLIVESTRSISGITGIFGPFVVAEFTAEIWLWMWSLMSS